MSRDWTKTLWQASYKGVPFYTDREEEDGGRRLKVNEFPLRDDPYIQDMGQRAKPYSVTAYLVGDTSDGDSSTLAATFDAAGSGVLVLPVQGPIANVYCETFKRSASKDKMGLIAFDARFWRDGVTGPLATTPFLAQLVFDAITSLQTVVQPLAAAAIVAGPSFLADNLVTGWQNNVAGLEAIRAQASIAIDQSAAIATQVQALYTSVATSISQSIGVDGALASNLIGAAVAIADAMPFASAASSFGTAYDAVPPVSAPPTLTQNAANDAANQVEVARQYRLALLAAYVDAVTQATYASRQDGIAARSALVARFDVELGECGANDGTLYVALQTLRSNAVSYLTKVIADLRPVVTVTAQRLLPSLWWAWRLYQDPTRAAEIVARNDVAHPSFCPQQLQVLAPTVALPTGPN